MKILLISPKSSDLFSNNPKIQAYAKNYKELNTLKNNWKGISYGLLIVAALTPPYYEIELVDEDFDEIDFTKKYDLVVISTITKYALRTYNIADCFKSLGVKVVLGGIHPTVMLEEAKEHCDAVVSGEAENLWPEILKDFENNKLKPFYKSNQLFNLANSPIPRYELLKQNRYNIIWIQTSRGCPHNCEFCGASKLFGLTYRQKPLDKIIEEIQKIKLLFPNVIVGFGDDNFLLNKTFSKKLLNKLIPLKIRWSAFSDVSIGNDIELIQLMKSSGCINVFLGFETVNKKSLKKINRNNWKYKHLKSYSAYIQNIQSAGINIMGSFIIGFDDDDEFTFRDITKFAIENNIYTTQITFLTPLPGSALWERFKKENRLLPINWDEYGFLDVTFVHPKFSKEELINHLIRMYQQIYSDDVYKKKIAYFKNIYKNIIASNNSNRS
jgi:radical SAM superfamily enzyme YgiQ (UPF0313 family)